MLRGSPLAPNEDVDIGVDTFPFDGVTYLAEERGVTGWILTGLKSQLVRLPYGSGPGPDYSLPTYVFCFRGTAANVVDLYQDVRAAFDWVCAMALLCSYNTVTPNIP